MATFVVAKPAVVLAITKLPDVPLIAFTHAGPLVVTMTFGAPAEVGVAGSTTMTAPYNFWLEEALGFMAPFVPASVSMPRSTAVVAFTASFEAELKVRISYRSSTMLFVILTSAKQSVGATTLNVGRVLTDVEVVAATPPCQIGAPVWLSMQICAYQVEVLVIGNTADVPAAQLALAVATHKFVAGTVMRRPYE